MSAASRPARTGSPRGRVSVVIPARNEGPRIGEVVRAVLAQRGHATDIEVIVADNASSDDTAVAAADAGARAFRVAGEGGNPAAARNQGAALSTGDPIVFLDADCVPRDGWLRALLAVHDAGAAVVGGSLDLPPGLPFSARCDYYCGWYLVHSRRPPGLVPHHPPPNLSVRREAFRSTRGFSEEQPLAYTNEERAWQAELRRRGQPIYFEPKAVAYHYNRPGFWNLVRRNYRWAYTAVQAKSGTGSARAAWLYRYPLVPIFASGPLALAHTLFILGCWARVGVFEPLLMWPVVALSRLAYATGMTVGGVRWLRRRWATPPVPRLSTER